MPDIKLGSLFDGIGVFPLAASRCGIRPVWASEIEKAPISITKRHFPDMVHLGDITKVDGGKIPPVHIITFGSPCQNPVSYTHLMLPKCWRRQNGKIYLYKGGTSGFSNLGFEPYSERYAYQVAQVMGVNAIRYTLTKDLKKTLCSKCELFTSKEYSYIPIG